MESDWDEEEEVNPTRQELTIGVCVEGFMENIEEFLRGAGPMVLHAGRAVTAANSCAVTRFGRHRMGGWSGRSTKNNRI